MKRYILSLLMLCTGYAGMLNAANTDISSINNVIYIEPFTAAQGTQVQMSIKMKNTAAIRGFQFDLFLPEGVTVAKTAKGKYIGSLNEDRLPAEDEHTLILSEQTDGSIRFLCGSLYDETFTGTDGEIVTLTVNIDGNMVNGNYAISLKNMKLTETDISKFYETEEVETTLTVTGATGINSIELQDPFDVYTLDGIKVRSKVTTTENLPSGVYIVNGRNVVVK